ncbi:MAG: ubiquinol-cytochrome C chaperone family protein [Alphaproteobacteria bacterium]
MLGRLFGERNDGEAIAADLYGAIVARARRRQIYAEFGVPDTVAGRFEMVLLHMTIFLERLETGSPQERALGQRVFEIFCDDMDKTLREFGVGDAVMGKRMKKMTQSYYGRSKAYRAAFLMGSDDELLHALGRNLFPDRETSLDPQLAVLARAARADVAAVAVGEFEQGAAALDSVAVAPVGSDHGD